VSPVQFRPYPFNPDRHAFHKPLNERQLGGQPDGNPVRIRRQAFQPNRRFTLVFHWLGGFSMVRVSKLRRKNGYWHLRFWMNGRSLDESARTQSEAVAETARIRREMEINAGIQPIQHGDAAELIGRYLDSLPPGTSKSHKHEARRILNGFLRICGRPRRDGSHNLQTHQITPAMIDRFIARRKTERIHDGRATDSRGRKVVRTRQISNVSLRKELRYLGAWFNWMCRQRPPLLRENPIPLSNSSRLKNDAKPHFMITEDEFRVLLANCKTLREYLFLILGWWTGARRGELLALHFYHFDFKVRTLQVAHQKNNMHSVLPIPQQIIDIVETLYHGAKEAERVFPTDPLPSHRFGRFCLNAGVRHHRFHDFRISCSMRIKSGGFDASLAGLWVGNTATTNQAHYSDLGAVAPRIASLLELSDLPPVPQQTA